MTVLTPTPIAKGYARPEGTDFEDQGKIAHTKQAVALFNLS
jgi:hypothetical protein